MAETKERSSALGSREQTDPFVLYNQQMVEQSSLGSGALDEDQSNALFNNLIKLQKRTGNMFLFGDVTPKVFEIIIRMYHENIARQLSEVEVKKNGFMLGILETQNGEILMTISEDPTEDTNFEDKISSLKRMLKNANINIAYPKNETGGISEIPTDTDYTKYPTKSKLGNLCDVMYVDCDATPITYSFDKIEATLINSEQYLKDRRNGKGFLPFKKYSNSLRQRYSEEPKIFFECNNGSTCVEAKLFSYLYNDEEPKDYSFIKGFAAYWVAGNVPPNHYLAKYSYCDSQNPKKTGCTPDDDQKLTNMTNRLLLLPKIKAIAKKYNKSGKNDNTVCRSILQPLALSCPGCLLNWFNYTNNITSNFNYSNCQNRLLSESSGLRQKIKPSEEEVQEDEKDQEDDGSVKSDDDGSDSDYDPSEDKTVGGKKSKKCKKSRKSRKSRKSKKSRKCRKSKK